MSGDKVIHLNDEIDVYDSASIALPNKTISVSDANPVATQIIIKNSDTGDVIWEGHNKTVIDGSQYMATRIWGVKEIVPFADYNTELGIANISSDNPPNDPVIQLFAVGIDGCGQEAAQRYPVKYTSHIPSTSLVPFRYEKGEDLDYEQRETYFGRKVFGVPGSDTCRYAYYYKALQSKQLHMKFVDGTEVTKDVYNFGGSTKATTYIEAELKITKSDCRDIFSSESFRPTLGDGSTVGAALTLADARINSLTLIRAWYRNQADPDTGNVYKNFMDVHPVTTLHFPNIALVDGSIGLSIIYRMFF